MLVTELVCLLFGVVQVAYSQFMKAFCLKQLTAAAGKSFMIAENHDNKVVGHKTQTMS